MWWQRNSATIFLMSSFARKYDVSGRLVLVASSLIKGELLAKFIYFRSDILATLKSCMKSKISSEPKLSFKICICKSLVSRTAR